MPAQRISEKGSIVIRPGPRNAITDVSGILVGQAGDEALLSGVTVVRPESAAVAAVDCRGGGPGTRETDALKPENLVDAVHAVVLSGGSAMGLEAAGGVAECLRREGRGFPVLEGVVVPIVPSAVLFDLHNGGDKGLIREGTYHSLGTAAYGGLGDEVAQGNHGAGTGARAGAIKGGLGTASLLDDQGFVAGALVAVNAFGSVLRTGGGRFWASDWLCPEDGVRQPEGEVQDVPMSLDFDFESPFRQGANTTIAVVAVNGRLSRSQALRVAIMAQDGLARAIRPAHTPFDGDTVFVLATGERELGPMPPVDVARLGMMAADCLCRAVMRGVYLARDAGNLACYRTAYGVE